MKTILFLHKMCETLLDEEWQNKWFRRFAILFAAYLLFHVFRTVLFDYGRI